MFAGELTGVGAGSVAWGDYDNDGDLDILLAGINMVEGFNIGGSISKIYQNTGNGFTEVLPESLTKIVLGSVAWGDYDNDGDLDILLTGLDDGGASFSKIYQNTGKDFTEVFAGSLTGGKNTSSDWGDYDNDGDLDILLTGKIYQNTGSGFTEVFVGSLTNGHRGSSVWGDYDNDGDLDILLTGQKDGGVSNSAVYQNTGSGFTEVFIGSLTAVFWSSSEWGDYDNDGDLDILLTGATNMALPYDPISKVYQNTGSGFTEIFAGSLTAVHRASSVWGDYDNDGDLDILLTGSTGSVAISKIYQNTGTTFNTPPTVPTNLNADVSKNVNAVTLSWNQSTDNETPSAGLTYNIRIGTVSQGIDALTPMADVTTGYRRVVQMGNVNHNTTWIVNDLPNGKYFWSVQAIDNSFAGSPFASEVAKDNTVAGGTFEIAKYRTFKESVTDFSAKTVKLAYKKGKDKVYRLVAPPNILTALENVFAKQVPKTLYPKGRTFLGVSQTNTDSIKAYAWINIKKAADLKKGFKTAHTGQSYPLDYLRNVAKGTKKKLSKAIKFETKYNNPAMAQGILLKLNILASDSGITTKGFGSLVLDTSATLAGRQMKGQTLTQIANYFDSIMTYWKRSGVDTTEDYKQLGSVKYELTFHCCN